MAIDAVSKVLFYWTSRGGTPIPIIGGDPHHTRSSIGTFVDRPGRVRDAAINTPRFNWASVSGEDRPVMRLEQARNNDVTYKRDLTNAAWTKSNVTPTKDQVGADGTANGATRLTATAGNGTALLSLTLASTQRLQSAYVRRITGSSTVDMTTDGGTHWESIAITDDWARFAITARTLANPIVGFRLQGNGDEIAVDFVQNEPAPSKSSVIAGTDAAATRATDTMYWDSLLKPQALAGYLRYVYRGVVDAGLLTITGATLTNPRLQLYLDASGYATLYHNNGSAAVTAAQSVAAADGDTVELVPLLLSTGAVGLIQSINGAPVTAPANSGTNALAAAWGGTRKWLNAKDATTSIGCMDAADVKFVQYSALAAGTAQGIMDEMRAFEMNEAREIICTGS